MRGYIHSLSKGRRRKQKNMSIDESNGMVMPVTPMYGGGYGNGGGFGNGFGGDFLYIIILFLFCMMGGFGNGFGGFGGNAGNDIYPWMNQSNQINGGFRDQMLNTSINGIQNAITSGFGDVQTALCGGFAGVNAGIANGFAQAEISANARQMADMNQMFAVQSALQNCCCENRLATANLGADIAREACATRTSDTQNTQVILNAINEGFRQMSDQRYQDKIDAKNDEIAQLRQENLYARGQASQIAQNTAIINGVYNRLNECPVGTVPVYGEQPIFTCPNNGNGGCGCGSF